jgi:hypothetical protein
MLFLKCLSFDFNQNWNIFKKFSKTHQIYWNYLQTFLNYLQTGMVKLIGTFLQLSVASAPETSLEGVLFNVNWTYQGVLHTTSLLAMPACCFGGTYGWNKQYMYALLLGSKIECNIVSEVIVIVWPLCLSLQQCVPTMVSVSIVATACSDLFSLLSRSFSLSVKFVLIVHCVCQKL